MKKRKKSSQQYLLICNTCKIEYLSKKLTQKYCSHKCISKNRVHSEEENKKIGLGLKKFYSKNSVWNKGLTIDTSDSIKKMSNTLKDPNGKFQKSMHTEAYKEKMKILASGENNGFYGKKHTEEQKLKWSISRADAIAEGKYHLKTKHRNGMKGWYFSSKMNDTFYYDSFWELLRMILLDNDPITITWTKRHKIKIKYIIDDKIKHYVPDFLINNNIIEEVKGYENKQIQESKFSALIDFCAINNLKNRIIKYVDLNNMCKEFFNKQINTLRKEFKQKCGYFAQVEPATQVVF